MLIMQDENTMFCMFRLLNLFESSESNFLCADIGKNGSLYPRELPASDELLKIIGSIVICGALSSGTIWYVFSTFLGRMSIQFIIRHSAARGPPDVWRLDPCRDSPLATRHPHQNPPRPWWGPIRCQKAHCELESSTSFHYEKSARAARAPTSAAESSLLHHSHPPRDGRRMMTDS